MFDRKEYEGKRALRRWPKWLPVVAALALATAVTVGGTLAWLTAHTNSVTNTFTMGDVDPQVSEDLTNDTKSNITVTNNGSVEAYVRVALVFSWREGENVKPGQYENGEQPDGKIVAGTPEQDEDYTMSVLGAGWVLGTDGYYYYKYPVKPNTSEDPSNPSEKSQTSSLGTIEVIANDKSQQYNLDVQVLADSIQSKPTTAVETTWPVTVNTETGEIQPN